MTDKSYPPAVAPVRGVRVTVDGVRRSSNWQFAALLVDDAGRGRNPMELPPALLTAAGHPKRSPAQLCRDFACNASGQYVPDDRPALSRLIAVPAFCDDLCGSARLGCSAIDCPMWAYRRGNPHHGRRGDCSGVLNLRSAQKNARQNPFSAGAFAVPGVPVPADAKEAVKPTIDAISARPHTGPNPATASVLSDAAQPKLSRNSRAASAHRKDKHNG